MSTSRIIFIPGIITSPKIQQFQWGRAAREMFPDREIVCLKRVYVYPQHEILLELKEQALDMLRDGKPTMVVGHSFGGIIATAAAQQAQREGLENVVRLITWATPHTMDVPDLAHKIPVPDSIHLGLEEARQAVGYRHEPLNIPVYTQGSRFDHVVPHRFTHFPGEQKYSLSWGSHSGYWLNPRSWKFRRMWDDLRD